MSPRLVTPTTCARRDIRCDVGDAIVANLAIHFVFFFDRALDVDELRHSFARTLERYFVFGGRLTVLEGRMAIRCRGRGVPFTIVSSPRTLLEAMRATADDTGQWLVDPVNGTTERLGVGPLCRIQITRLADDATAIGVSWHHVIGDMRTFMLFMNAWAASFADRPISTPLIVDDRAAYVTASLPDSGTAEPRVRCLSPAEAVRSVWYLAKNSRRQRTVSMYFADSEIDRIRGAYARRARLSVNDVVCAHVAEALMSLDHAVDRRTLAIAVDIRDRCGLDASLVGNILATLHVDLRRGDDAIAIAQRVRDTVDHFADHHSDMRANQQFMDGLNAWQAARVVSTAFDPTRWNPLVTNLSGFGVHDIVFDGARPVFCTQVLKLPVAGLGALMDGAGGRGMVFIMSLPPDEFAALTNPQMRAHLHRFRHPDDEVPWVHRSIHP